jgi:hypothetical protein
VNSTKKSTLVTNSSFLNLHPAQPICLSSDFDIEQFVNAFNVSYQMHPTITLMGLNGINVTGWTNKEEFSSMQIVIANSVIIFYVNETQITDIKCSNELLTTSTKSKNATFFNSFGIIDFRYQNTYPSEPICPFMFSNAGLLYLNIFSLINAILVNNLWKFQLLTTNSNNLTTINSNIYELDLAGYGFSLNTSLMHPLVFKSTKRLSIYKSIGSIQTGLFKQFNELSYLYFSLQSLKNFFHKIGIPWTQDLNRLILKLLVFSSVDSQNLGFLESSYNYPNQDFCLFANYPQPNYTIFILDSYLTECTHTLRWLMLNYINNDLSSYFSSWPNIKLIYSICNSTKENNDFKNLTDQCNISYDTGSSTIYVEYYQVQFILEFIQDLFEFIAMLYHVHAYWACF